MTRNKITKGPVREIIEDFAKEIKSKRTRGATPSVDVIDFRNWVSTGLEQKVYYVPTDLLRFRKDNGRIASDVLSYEKNNGPLSETDAEDQKILRDFLEKKDPEKTEELMNSIEQGTQRNAAIITADGFLINGNRRKMAIEKLWEKTQKKDFQYMKVIILPDSDDKDYGGPPTIKEIEQIENRYQLQSEGKSEYYNFDRALSMRRKIEIGMTLEEQLRDDPRYINKSKKEFNAVLRKFKADFLEPLECIDDYLELLGRSGLYHTISTGVTDREGRWQAFLDFSKHVRKKLRNEAHLIKMGLEEDEIGDVEEIAFKIIRKREFPGMKVHKIMRDLPKWLENNEAKEELFKLLDIDLTLSNEESKDEKGQEYDERKKDQIWNSKNQNEIIHHVKEAHSKVERMKELETPLTLLEAALKKLQHKDMKTASVAPKDMTRAMKLAQDVKMAADALESEFYHHKKNIKKLNGKNRKK
ncbi:MAG: hypothetical protein VX798_01410 [Bacteroidota bacterium]|nr:hypothetical protein [Bacteroidota bacterium]